MTDWISVDDELPPQCVLVNTMGHNMYGYFTECQLRRVEEPSTKASLWFRPWETKHVGYYPTHWKHIEVEE